MSLNSFGQVSLDTLYYDKDLKGVNSMAFATYYRVIDKSEDDSFRKVYRDYYPSGALAEEGCYTYIDKYDDAKSRFDGECVTYSSSGNVLLRRSYNDGVLDGEYVKYSLDGDVLKHAYYKDGLLDGLYTEYSVDDDRCTQIEYSEGEPRYDYYYLSNSQGFFSKVRFSDNQPIYESPSRDEQKTEYVKGVAWPYYEKNGIFLSMSNSYVKDYGKYNEIQVVLQNNSMFPIEFDPQRVRVVMTDKKGAKTELKVLTSEEYMKKVRRRQNYNMFMNAYGENSAASRAGYSTSTTKTNYSGGSTSSATSSAYGSRGYASGSASGKSSYKGTSTSTTQSYDAGVAYQAKLIASERIAAYNNQLLEERAEKEDAYLKKTTLYPGESLTGYFNIARKKGETMSVGIDINGALYQFGWNYGK
ncbi:MAG: hypothetical protein LUI09_07420 [Prevotellaceae bacterium]|nr:hypothetical protein [Prevotellaceae bacterium]